MSACFFWGGWAEALIDFDQSISVNPDFALVYFQKEMLHLKSGDQEKGCLDLHKAGNCIYSSKIEGGKQ